MMKQSDKKNKKTRKRQRVKEIEDGGTERNRKKGGNMEL